MLISPAEREVQDETVDMLVRSAGRRWCRWSCQAFVEVAKPTGSLSPCCLLLCSASMRCRFEDAEHVVGLVRRISSEHEFLDALRDGVNVKFSPDADALDVLLVDLDDPSNNEFVVTWEYPIATGGAREPRLDIVCLVNGLPLGLIENKAPDHDVAEAAGDWRQYYADVPELRVCGGVVACSNGVDFVVGPSGLDAIQHYKEWKTTWPHDPPTDGQDPMAVGLAGAFHPHTLLELSAHFIVFETRDGTTVKKLARYQQYRAASKIVARVLDGELDRGLIWHTTGSGKSLTMVFAARKLMRSDLDRPTVFIVIDRVQLDDQITSTLQACDFDGVRRATGGEDLRQLIDGDRRGVVVTVINKFQSIKDTVAERANVVVFVDEAHRSHEGEFGIWMRTALPNAKLFAFTGTPVETDDRSTRRAFSPLVERGDDGTEQFEPYLDSYTIKQAIEDGATVEVLYEPRLTHWQIETTDIDVALKAAFPRMSEEELELLRRDASRESVIAKAPLRVEHIAADIADLLTKRIIPSGFKGQLVAVDREACVLYAETLAQHLRENEYAVVMSEDTKRDDDRIRAWWPRASLTRVLERDFAAPDLTVTPEQAIRELVEKFLDPTDPLKLLIVNAMLLTGFDAPIEQAMFLDRPLHAHTLLQAIARTNRTAPGKDHGLIFDYWGVLADLDDALRSFEPTDIQLVAQSTEALAAAFPAAIAEALSCVTGMPTQGSDRRRMIWLVQHLADDSSRALRFEAAVRAAQRAYETLAPDIRLAPHLEDYRRLIHLHAVWRHGSRMNRFDVTPYRAKTHKLVHDAVTEVVLQRDLPVFAIDGSYLARLDEDGLSGEEKAAEIEAAVVSEIKERGDGDPLSLTLGERLEQLRDRRQRANQLTLDLLNEYEQLVRELVAEKAAADASGMTSRARAILALARRHAADIPAVELEDLCSRIDAALRTLEVDYDADWDRADMQRSARQRVIKALIGAPATRPLATTSFVDDALAAILARAADAR